MTLSNIAVATSALAFVIALLAIAHCIATRFKLAHRIIGKPDDKPLLTPDFIGSGLISLNYRKRHPKYKGLSPQARQQPNR